MRSYITRINDPVDCDKVGVRENVIVDKRPRPDHEYTYVSIPEPVRLNRYGYPRDPQEEFSKVMNPLRVGLEVVRYTICFWVEIERLGNRSMGYYHMINDYMEVPQGVPLTEFFNVREGQEINSVLGVMPYRDELDYLKQENGRLLCELELLKNIHRAEGGDENTLLERMGING